MVILTFLFILLPFIFLIEIKYDPLVDSLSEISSRRWLCLDMYLMFDSDWCLCCSLYEGELVGQLGKPII